MKLSCIKATSKFKGYLDTLEIHYFGKHEIKELQALNEFYILRARNIFSPDKNLHLIY